jgi:acyl-CoA thioester hydrolase
VVVAKLGTSSVTWRVGIFKKDEETGGAQPSNSKACAIVDFTHVYVDPRTGRPVPIPAHARVALSRILHMPKEKAKL